VSATNAIAKEYGLTINAEIDFNSIYEYTMSDLKAADASRIEIDKASKSDLMALGLSAQVVNDIVQAQSSKTLGILLVNEFTNNPRYPISDSDRSILLSKTTTSFVKLSNGSLLAQVVFDEVGGADGVREIIKESVAHAGSGTPAEIQTAVTKTFSAKIKHGFEAQSLAKKLIETKMHANFASIKAEFDATGRLSVTPRCVGIF
jgi:hypothetical protein